MLFVALFKVAAGTEEERVARRLQWQYPEGMRYVAEYWLQTPEPNVIAIFEADRIEPIIQAGNAWSDVFNINVFPATTAEKGMEMARQMME